MPEDTESQDSQAILEALKAELGVAAVRTRTRTLALATGVPETHRSPDPDPDPDDQLLPRPPIARADTVHCTG